MNIYASAENIKLRITDDEDYAVINIESQSEVVEINVTRLLKSSASLFALLTKLLEGEHHD